jgi:hypothetical protein
MPLPILQINLNLLIRQRIEIPRRIRQQKHRLPCPRLHQVMAICTDSERWNGDLTLLSAAVTGAARAKKTAAKTLTITRLQCTNHLLVTWTIARPAATAATEFVSRCRSIIEYSRRSIVIPDS